MKCPWCAAEQAETLFPTHEEHQQFKFQPCSSCNILFLQPRLQGDELTPWYPADYESYWQPIDQEPSRFRRWEHQRHARLLCRTVQQTHPYGGSLLDVGCGTGSFLYQLCQDRRWMGIGLDISHIALTQAHGQGLAVINADIDQISFPGGLFDVITLWEVLEHLPRPQAALRSIRRLLKPGGSLILSTPNAASWQAKLWGSSWRGWDIPRHLQIFTPQTLNRCLEETGFRMIRSFVLPFERYYGVESARQRLQSAHWFPWRSWIERAMPMLGMSIWPLFRLIDYMPFRSSIIIEARTPSS